QASLGGRGGKASSDAVFMGFDLLYLDGHDFLRTELRVRRHLLGDLISDQSGAIHFSEDIDGAPNAIFQAAKEHGLEGIVFKDRDSPYRR
uniref:ATP-dependent DNA ligase n=1 Tax=Streptococcus anginosus TaxID=1328 RepID=UPI002EDAC912